MEIKGKKINFLGDSITQGFGTSDASKCFVNLIVEREGIIGRNYGIGGTRFAKQINEPYLEILGRDFCVRALEMDNDADVVVVFGGTNDFGHGDAPFGRFENDKNNDTFCGAVHTLCKLLLKKYPNSDIVFITPLHRINEDNVFGECKPEPVATLKEYIDAIRKITEFYSIPVLDLFATSQIQPKVSCVMKNFMPDGLHPNDAGHEILARKITAYLKSL